MIWFLLCIYAIIPALKLKIILEMVKLPSTAVTRLLFCFGLFLLVTFFHALDFLKIYKNTLNQWDSFSTVTLAPLGSISYLYPVLYCDQKIA